MLYQRRFFDRMRRMVSRGNFFKIWQKLSLGLIILCSMAPAWSSDSHQRCALILGAEFHGQNFDEVTLAMRDPYLPAFAKNEALFIYWNNLLQNLKTNQEDHLLPIPTAPFSNEVDDLRYFTLVPAKVLADLPQEVKTLAPKIIAKLEKQTAILMEQLRALNRSDLTLYDKGILNVLLPWVMVHLAQQGI